MTTNALANIFGPASAEIGDQSPTILEIYYASDYQTTLFKATAQKNENGSFDVGLQEAFIDGWISTPENEASVVLFGLGIHGPVRPRPMISCFENVAESDLHEKMHEALMMKLAEFGAQFIITRARLWSAGRVVGSEEAFEYKSVRLLAQEHAPELLRQAMASLKGPAADFT